MFSRDAFQRLCDPVNNAAGSRTSPSNRWGNSSSLSQPEGERADTEPCLPSELRWAPALWACQWITPLLWCSALSLQLWGGCGCRNLHLQYLSKLKSASLLLTDFNKWLNSHPKWIWTSCNCQRLRRMKVAPDHVVRLIQLYLFHSTG